MRIKSGEFQRQLERRYGTDGTPAFGTGPAGGLRTCRPGHLGPKQHGTSGADYFKPDSQVAMAFISSSLTKCITPFIATVLPLFRLPLLMSFICASA